MPGGIQNKRSMTNKIIIIVCLSLMFPTYSFANTKIINSNCSITNKIKTVNKINYICTKQKNGKNTWKKVAKVIIANQVPVSQLTNIQKVYKNMTESFETNKNFFKINVIKSPNVNEKRVNEIVSYYEKSINMYPMPSNKKITWVFLDETEKDWWMKKSSEIDTKTNFSWWDTKCKISTINVCAYGNADSNLPIYYMVVGSSSQWKEHDQYIADHEAAHVYQSATWSNSHTNCWIVEGYANAFGLAFFTKTIKNNGYRQGQIYQIKKIFPGYLYFSVDDWINAYKKINLDDNFCFRGGAGYNMGMLAIESMYDLYNGKKVNDFIIDYSKTRNFNKSLIKYFNVNETEFYNNVAKYAKKAISTL